MTAGGDQAKPKPAGAWTAEQTVEYMIDKVFEEGDFYVICPDNETSSVSWANLTFSPYSIRRGLVQARWRTPLSVTRSCGGRVAMSLVNSLSPHAGPRQGEDRMEPPGYH